MAENTSTSRYDPADKLDVGQVLAEAENRWLCPPEICEILEDYRNFRITPSPPDKPPSGTLFLFDRNISRYFRMDGHNWRKKKDGMTVQESHEKLKVGGVDVLNSYCARGEENENFERRCYWKLDKDDNMHIVLVHYLEVKDPEELQKQEMARKLHSFTSSHEETYDPDKRKAISVEETSGIEQAVSSISLGSPGVANQITGSVKQEQEGTSNYPDKGKAISVEEESGIEQAVSSISWGSYGPASQMTGSVKQEHAGAFSDSKSNDWFYLDMMKETPTSPIINEHGKGKAVSVEEKSGARKLGSMSLRMSDHASQEKVDNDNSLIAKTPTSPRVSERDRGDTVSVEEKSGIGDAVHMSLEMSGPVIQKQEGSGNSMYDSTGKLLPINLEKQMKHIPTVQENIDVRANIIFFDRDYSDDSDPHIPNRQETILPTVSQPEGQDNTKIGNPKKRKRRRFNLFPWRNKK